jgi:4-diphosphocytidyl-2-C-methyl-D-erythritol kinase
MRLLAPAKINLHLRVGKPRADGFHPIVSWMCTIGLFDTLIVDRSPGGETRLWCDQPWLPCDSSNLVVKAAGAMAGALAKGKEALEGTEMPEFGLSVRLLKRIPVGAGLGGGSSDGAFMLQALNVLWNAGRTREQLADLAARLGSDLPFFLYGPSAVCRGRGELVQPLSPPKPRFAMVMLPGRPLATPLVYRRFDEMKLGDAATKEVEPDWENWTKLDARSLLPLLVNDLEAPAFAIDPELGRLRADVETQLGRPVRMSGSGSGLFTLFDTESEAASAANAVKERLEVETLAVAVAPVIGDDVNEA